MANSITRYAAAIVYLLDRDTGKEKKVYLYPITRVELVTQETSLRTGAQQTLVVGKDGRWSNVQ